MSAATLRRHHRHAAAIAAALLLFAGADAAAAKAPAAPKRVQSWQQLAKILGQHSTTRFLPMAVPMPAAITTAAGKVVAAATDSASVSHSETNLQVQGVDEADTVKVGDDGRIYQIQGAEVRVIRGYPLDRLGVEATLRFGGSFQPTGLLVANNRLVVLGNNWESAPAEVTRLAGGWSGFSKAEARVYRLGQSGAPVLERQVAVEGYYLDTRRIGPAVYLLARTYPRYYLYPETVRATAPARTAAQLAPAVRDTATAGGKAGTVKLANLYYFPGFVEPDYVVAAGFRLDQPKQAADLKAYLGAGEVVYASTANLYLSASAYPFVALGRAEAEQSQATPAPDPQETTRIYKYALNAGTTGFLMAGEVPGRVLNQFSMDEADGRFRIATTLHDWLAGADNQRNGVYVLDANLAIVGRLENLAKGEQIYAARFIGSRCYLVTFRTTDPLFVIDLAAPENPRVLGQLKLPGYSNYLHPYDDTHLLGFGKAALEVAGEAGNADQFWAGMSAFYQGMKLSLFDVSDVANPRELHTVTIGDRGTDSELLRNHKALYQDPARHLYGFPIEVARLPLAPRVPQPWDYGQPEFQGAYVYEVTPERGFVQKAAISHLAIGQAPDWSNSSLFIERLVGIESDLYSLSPDLLQVHSLDTFKELTEIPLTGGGTPSGETTPSTKSQ